LSVEVSSMSERSFWSFGLRIAIIARGNNCPQIGLICDAEFVD